MSEQPPAAAAKPPRDPAAELRQLFDTLERSFKDSDRALLGSVWDSRGIDANLVGDSGLTGAEAFDQGSRKRWCLRPDWSQVAVDERTTVVAVPCAIWSWDKERAVDRVVALVVLDCFSWRVLGAGERREEVEALSQRLARGEPLAPE